MRQVLNSEKLKEVCNAAALTMFISGVSSGMIQSQETEDLKRRDQLAKNRDWDGLTQDILKKGDNTNFSKYDVDQQAALRGYMNAHRAVESWRKNKEVGRDQIMENIKYFSKLRDEKLAEIKRKFKLKDLR